MNTILVVDDQMELRTLFQRVLQHGGHNVVVAGDGQEALRLTESWKPDAILLDVAMPRMDGLEFLTAIRRRPGWEAVPVIVLSGMMSPQQIAAAKQLGISDRLIKGEFTTRQLRACIAQFLPCSSNAAACTAA